MRMLVTGGAGFLGSFLVKRLLSAGNHVAVIDLPDKIKGGRLADVQSNPNLEIYPGTILDKDLMDKLVWQSDTIFHFAAVVGVSHYVTDPFSVLAVNINATQMILELALKYGKKVVFASTSEVYGKSTKVPFNRHLQKQGIRPSLG